jgi:NADH-quinone oxidoreductase subunit F
VLNGAAWYRQFGTEKSTGTKLVSISGHVNRPGVYEIPFGITLRDLLEKHCEGVQGNLQAVLMGGAAGTFLQPDKIDVRLTYEDLQAAGSTLGSGAIMVFNDTVDLRDVLGGWGDLQAQLRQVLPVSVGTQRQMEILNASDHFLPGVRSISPTSA